MGRMKYKVNSLYTTGPCGCTKKKFAVEVNDVADEVEAFISGYDNIKKNAPNFYAFTWVEVRKL